jgi:hypothetical protein
MFKARMSSDSIQFGILMVSGIMMIGGFWGYCEAHFATADTVKDVKVRVDKFDDLPADIAVMKNEIHEINKKLDRMNQ